MSREQGLSPKEMGIEGENFAVRSFDEVQEKYVIKAPFREAISKANFKVAKIIEQNGGATEEEIEALGFVKKEETTE